MKNIKQLEKEIDIKKEKFVELMKILGNFNSGQLRVLDREREKAKLQTLQNVCEEILDLDDKHISLFREKYSQEYIQGWLDACEELLKKFQGEKQ